MSLLINFLFFDNRLSYPVQSMIVVGLSSGVVEIRDMETGKVITRLEGHSAGVTGLQYRQNPEKCAPSGVE